MVLPIQTVSVGMVFLRENWHVRKQMKLKASEVRKDVSFSMRHS